MNNSDKKKEIEDFFQFKSEVNRNWYKEIYSKYKGLINVIGQENADQWRINELKIKFGLG